MNSNGYIYQILGHLHWVKPKIGKVHRIYKYTKCQEEYLY